MNPKVHLMVAVGVLALLAGACSVWLGHGRANQPPVSEGLDFPVDCKVYGIGRPLRGEHKQWHNSG